jgi:hypothetical protein
MTLIKEKTLTEIKVIDTNEKIYLISDLENELKLIDKQIAETEKEPNEIVVPNTNKLDILDGLKKRKEEINNLLK